MKIFKLPDLGEGLTEAEIVEWQVAVGDAIEEDQPLLAVETAKAIVDIPSPETGRVDKLYGDVGDIVQVGDPLVEFASEQAEQVDTGTVVGQVEVGQEVVQEQVAPIGSGPAQGSVKATPAVRALARRLDVDLSIVTPSGPDGMVTAADVQRVSHILKEMGPQQPLRGVRRAMARSMTHAHAEVVPVTISEDADIHTWNETTDTSIRLICAIVAGCKAEPSLNTWFDSAALGRRVLPSIHLGIAVDTGDGLFVPVLRDVEEKSPQQLRTEIDQLKEKVRSRKIPPEELRGYTFTLSNFGTFTGRYANPIVVPPTVAILGAGMMRDEVVAWQGKIDIHKILPISLTFDHRAVTGGEAARFLKTVIDELEQSD